MKMKQWVFAVLLVILIIAVFMIWRSFGRTQLAVTDFKTCAAAGRPIMESYPRQCAYGGKTYSEDIGNGLKNPGMIQVNNPLENQTVASPLTVTGQALGGWYFEASFPVKLFDASNNLLAEGSATALSDWMTNTPVPFSVTLNFATQPVGSAGMLILYKSNMSGLPINDDQVNIPVTF